MNTEQLLDLVDTLIADEERLTLNQKLTKLTQALNNLVANPQNPPSQTDVANRLNELSKALAEFGADHSPAFVDRMSAISALPYFSSAMVARLQQAMADNPMTPAVVQQEAQDLLNERTEFVQNLRSLKDAMEALGFEEGGLEAGQAEIGFQIPRVIFKNELDGFSQELHQLRLIIRAFSEAAGNPGERIELRQISTTDPLIFLWLGRQTIKLIGDGVKWCLDQWKTLEEIRHLRATTANLKALPAAQAIAGQFDALIKESVETNVRQEAKRLASQSNADAPRKNELANHLELALNGLLARVERGMTIEIRFLPPAVVVAEDEEEGQELPTEYQELKTLQQQLVFPPPSEEPLLKLTKQPEAAPKEIGGKTRGQDKDAGKKAD